MSNHTPATPATPASAVNAWKYPGAMMALFTLMIAIALFFSGQGLAAAVFVVGGAAFIVALRAKTRAAALKLAKIRP